MSLETDAENNPQTQTTPTPSPRPLAPKESERNRNIHSIILVCSLALIGCFFLPWIKFLFGIPSGYDLQQLPSDEAKLVWLIPATALVALLAAIAKQVVLVTAQIAGAMPFLALIYYRVKLGEELFQILQIGAYLSLALGSILFIAARFSDKPKSS
jgi:hypothetical protein